MLTVPEAARRVGRDPETVRRWIRSGKLTSQKVGTQYLVDEAELDELAAGRGAMLPLPLEWDVEPRVDWVRLLREDREGAVSSRRAPRAPGRSARAVGRGCRRAR